MVCSAPRPPCGACTSTGQENAQLFEMIVRLQTGEALIFCPSALFDIRNQEVCRLANAFIKAKIRARVTADGGRSIMALDEGEILEIGSPANEVTILPFVAPNMVSPVKRGHPGQANVSSAAMPIAPRTSLSFANTVTAAAAEVQTSTQRITRSLTRLSVPKTPPPPPPPPVQPNHNVNTGYVTGCLRAAVTEHLLKQPRRLPFKEVRHAAARAANLQLTFFDVGEWRNRSKAIIHNQMV